MNKTLPQHICKEVTQLLKDYHIIPEYLAHRLILDKDHLNTVYSGKDTFSNEEIEKITCLTPKITNIIFEHYRSLSPEYQDCFSDRETDWYDLLNGLYDDYPKKIITLSDLQVLITEKHPNNELLKTINSLQIEDVQQLIIQDNSIAETVIEFTSKHEYSDEYKIDKSLFESLEILLSIEIEHFDNERKLEDEEVIFNLDTSFTHAVTYKIVQRLINNNYTTCNIARILKRSFRDTSSILNGSAPINLNDIYYISKYTNINVTKIISKHLKKYFF